MLKVPRIVIHIKVETINLFIKIYFVVIDEVGPIKDNTTISAHDPNPPYIFFVA